MKEVTECSRCAENNARWDAALILVEHIMGLLGYKVESRQDPDWHKLKDLAIRRIRTLQEVEKKT